MLRSALIGKHADHVDGFRWRSHEITRIEGFSDAVFGFAITLLIVSLEVPRTSTELLATMRGFGAFVVTFIMLAGLWYSQYSFFRRYGLEDRTTVILNLALLFTVLFFVFPLNFLFNHLIGDPTLRHAMVETAHGPEPAILRTVYVVYPSRRHLPAKVRIFIDALAALVEPMQPLEVRGRPARRRHPHSTR